MTRTPIPLISKGTPDYDSARARAIWNKRIDTVRSPEAIVRCSSTEEVSAAIRYAHEQGLKVSPRGSGHHYEGAALREGGLLLDFGGLDEIEIDAEARTARVGAGVCGGKLTERLAQHDLAFPVGHCVDVGLSGYLLAGGFGWNAGEWGAACGNVVAMEMVSANAEIVRVDAHNEPDLFWAARGGGPGFFAAVTAYHLRLHPLPAAHAWRVAFKAKDGPKLADWLNAATAASPPSVEVGCFLLSHWETGEPAVVLRVSACGEDADAAREALAAFHSPPAEAEQIGEVRSEAVPFSELFKMSPMPDQMRASADHVWSDAPLGELLAAVHSLTPPSAHSTVDIVGFGGNACIALPDDGALSVVGRAGAGIYALWDDRAEDADNCAWVRRVDDALAPLRSGRYVGEADLTLGPERRLECFTRETLKRLDALRARYDPDGVFFAYP